VAVDAEEVARFDLLPQSARPTIPELCTHSPTRSTLHVEAEALDPDDLRRLYEAAWTARRDDRRDPARPSGRRVRVPELHDPLNDLVVGTVRMDVIRAMR
jgi:hypothetical protein